MSFILLTQSWKHNHSSFFSIKFYFLSFRVLFFFLNQFFFLGEVLRYDLYYSLTHTLKWKFYGLKTCTDPHYLVLNFYQINEDGEIQTRDRLVIKALIPYQRTILTQKFKLLGEVLRYDLYYSLTTLGATIRGCVKWKAKNKKNIILGFGRFKVKY